MADIREIHDSLYSPRLSIVLRSLGGDPDQIKAYWQDRLDNPSEEELEFRRTFPMFGNLTPEDAAEAAYNQIKQEIERLYFAGTPRDVAVTIANALMRTDGRFEIVPGESDLCYYDIQFARTWNKHNPNAEPIRGPHNDIG